MDVTDVAVLAGVLLLYILMGWLFFVVYWKRWGPARRAALVFLVLFPLDVLGGGGVFTGVTGLLAALVQLVLLAFRALGGERRKALAHLAAAGVYLATFGSARGYMAFSAYVGRRGSATTIAACRAYEAKHGHLPKALTDLVPDFLPSVPRANYTATGHLFYSPKPPASLHYYFVYTRRVYNFETDSWAVQGW